MNPSDLDLHQHSNFLLNLKSLNRKDGLFTRAVSRKLNCQEMEEMMLIFNSCLMPCSKSWQRRLYKAYRRRQAWYKPQQIFLTEQFSPSISYIGGEIQT